MWEPRTDPSAEANISSGHRTMAWPLHVGQDLTKPQGTGSTFYTADKAGRFLCATTIVPPPPELTLRAVGQADGALVTALGSNAPPTPIEYRPLPGGAITITVPDGLWDGTALAFKIAWPAAAKPVG